MRVLISGQAGLALVLDEPRQIRALDKQPVTFPEGFDAHRIFDGCTDVTAYMVADTSSIDALTEAAWERDRALRLFLLLIDPDEPAEFLSDYCDCLADLFVNSDVYDFVLKRMSSEPLPVKVNTQVVFNAAREFERVTQLLHFIFAAQESSASVRQAFNNLSGDFFDSPNAKDAFYTELVTDGSIADLTLHLASGSDISFLRLKLANKYLHNKSGIMQWTAMLQSGFKKPKPTQTIIREDDDIWEEEEDLENQYRSNPEVFRQVKLQQARIIDCIKDRNVEGARHLAEALIIDQRSMSNNEQIAKSLSLLAQEAKLQEVPELQLEWAERATRENPADPKTFGHLADALIALSRFADARSALDSAEAVGGRMFAENGRARIFRLVGDFEAARSLYLSTASDFDGMPGVEHSYIGAADTLRDMGQGEAAIVEFKRATEMFPLSASAWTGLAYALLDIGRLDDAILNFGKSNATSRNTNSKNGRANALRYAGNFAESKALYKEVIESFPNNSVALCGHAEVLRAEGQLEAALEAYSAAITRLPYSPAPLNGKCSVLLDLNRYKEARDTYKYISERFPHDEASAIGVAKTCLKLGDTIAALQKINEVISNSPFSIDAKLFYAQVHRYLGNYTESLRAYTAAVSEFSYSQAAIIGRISLLIAMGRFEEADKFLPSAPPKTSRDWTRYALRAMIIVERQGKAAAVKWLERGLNQCPFYHQRKIMRSTLISVEIGRGNVEVASKIAAAAPGETSNVIAFHAYAATNKKVVALNLYGQMLEVSAKNSVIDLATEIGRRYGLLGGENKRDKGWIERAERRFILNEAA